MKGEHSGAGWAVFSGADTDAKTSVVAELSALGFTVVDEGQLEGAGAQSTEVQLVITDVGDGPGEDIPRLRARYRTARLLAVVSTTRTAAIASLLKCGVDDVMLKPLRTEDLRAKVQAPARPRLSRFAPPAVDANAVEQGEVLVVDDAPHVHARLREMIDPHVAVDEAVTESAAVAICGRRRYRLVLFDLEMPDVAPASLVERLRATQPGAAFVALALRNDASAQALLRTLAMDGVLHKPFDPTRVEELVRQYVDRQGALVSEGAVLRPQRFLGQEASRERYFARLGSMVEQLARKLASEGYEEATLDARDLPPDAKRVPYFAIALVGALKRYGVALRVVGPPEIAAMLRVFEETCRIPVCAEPAV